MISSLIVLCAISIFCLLAVSIDRYLAILHPIAYSRRITKKVAKRIIWFAVSSVQSGDSASCWLVQRTKEYLFRCPIVD
ncbi:hypothetical protein Avbf_18287 [Armadillidium vulgare]|nr:hypothetical protein Avbf_18287 [Armadillidium vulgare]